MSADKTSALVMAMRDAFQQQHCTYLEAEEVCWRLILGLLFECFPDEPAQVAAAIERVAKSAADRVRLGAIAAQGSSLQ